MRIATTRLAPGLGGLLILIAACESPSSIETADPFTPHADLASGSCDALQGISAQAAAYVPPEQLAEAELLLARVEDACLAGNSGVRERAWKTIVFVEAIAAEGTGLDLAAGSTLVNRLLSCISSRCLATAAPDFDLRGPLGPHGLFAVRGRKSVRTAIAHHPVPLLDFDGRPVHGLWGVEVLRAWPDVVFAPTVLLFGAPASGLVLRDVSVGNVQYDLRVFPDAGAFRDGALNVGICFSDEITLPHAAGDGHPPSLEPQLQRQGVLLEARVPAFCSTAELRTAAMGGAFAARLHALAAGARARIFRTDRKITFIGGSPLDFSTFAPVAADPRGRLGVFRQPPATLAAGQSIAPFAVRALSGKGTRLEKVAVTIHLVNAGGQVVDGALGGVLTRGTSELGDLQGVATFNSVFLASPGTYRICATGQRTGFTFGTICSAPFQGT